MPKGKVVRLRTHNPEGGGFKPASQVHKLKKQKKCKDIWEKLGKGGKLTLNDLRYLIEEKD